MNQKSLLSRNFLSLFPVLGILTFFGLYIYSTSLYPGGSQADVNSHGYDWINNYWCNLLNKKAINGITNQARPIALLAMFILCTSLLVFFINFALNLAAQKTWKNVILIGGTLSMIFAFLISTEYHDLMTILSSIFGLFVLIGISVELYRSDLRAFKITALICIGLLILNNYIYYSHNAISILPLLQKITFVIVLAWIVLLNLKIPSIKNV